MDAAILSEQHHFSTTVPARAHGPGGWPHWCFEGEDRLLHFVPRAEDGSTLHDVTVMQAAAWKPRR